MWRPSLGRLVLAALLILLPGSFHASNAAPRDNWRPRAATYDAYVVLRDVAIEMSDGLTVYADVFLPSRDGQRAAPGRFPTVMMITPYNKNLGAEPREYLVRRGYASVVAEPRGTGSSEGTWDFGSDRERRDGYELVEWAARQPWSTGAVGLIGDSYRGINQWWTAMQRPPHLKAIIPINPPADLYRTGGSSGGQMSSLVVAQSLVSVLGVPPGNRSAEDPRRAAQTAAARPSGAAIAASGTVDIILGGKQSYDNRYFRARGGYWNVDRIKVPTFIVGGWYDIAQRDAVLMFEELHSRGVPVKLVVGPWTHGDTGTSLPAKGLRYSLDELFLRWLDRWVAGRPDPGLNSFGPVVYNILNESRFATAAAWPPPSTSYRRLFLSGPAYPGRPGALSTRTPGENQGADMLPWQPVSGACSQSARQAALGAPPPSPCTTNGAANDMTGLAYDFPAGKKPLRLVGNIAAHLYVSTTRNDTFLNVRVESVAPDGTATALTDGNDTLSFRKLDRTRTTAADGLITRPFHPYTRESVEDIESGRIYDWWIEVLPVAAVIPAGHILRVTIQPSDAGQAIMIGERGGRLAGGVTSVHQDRAHPSAIVVPFQD